jgi:CheY-like chemotaxis protein
MDGLSVLLIGDCQREEFSAARQTLRATTRLVELTTINEALAWLPETADSHATQTPPDLIILAQAWPGQFSIAEVDRLRREAPWARLVGLLGSWCKGESRSGQPWPAVPRTYWHQWSARWQSDLQRLDRGLCPTWGLPVTAAADEPLLMQSDASSIPPASMVLPAGLVVLSTASSEMAGLLTAVCGELHQATVTLSAQHETVVSGAQAGIWDGTCLDIDAQRSLTEFRTMLGTVPVIALLDFPRREDVRIALDTGASCVVSKPFLVADLAGELRRLIQTPAVRAG